MNFKPLRDRGDLNPGKRTQEKIQNFRELLLALGMTAFGVPIGVAMGTALGNMGFIGVGIGMGLAIGIAIGTDMDKKARKEGRQLDFEARI